jgi:hypothetical protein
MGSDEIKIECDCGYVVRIPANQIESTEACINCGAVLDMTRISTTEPIPAPTTIPQTPQPAKTSRNPFEDPDEVHEFTQVPDDTSDPSAFTRTPNRDVNPFEDPDEVHEFTQAPDDTSVPSAITPTPNRDVNPFEDPDDDPSPFADDSSDLASDADNPKSYADATPKTDPSKLRSFTDAEHKNAYRGVEKEELCPRCGNPYRGDWDKRETIEGEMCYICSNQAVDGVPLRLQTEQKKKEEEGVLTPMGDLNKKPPNPYEENTSLFNTDSPKFRMFVAMLGLATIVVAIYMWQIDDFETWEERHSKPYEEPIDAFQEEVRPERLPAWASLALSIMNLVGAYVTWFLGTYAILTFRNKLPKEDFTSNALVIGFIQIVITIFLGAGFLTLGLFDDPTYSAIFRAMLYFFVLGVVIITYRKYFDFGIIDFWLFGIFLGISYWFVQMVMMFFKWGLATIVV